ncbi:MAG: glycosyltransferase [Burkholderiaceae bacterium]
MKWSEAFDAVVMLTWSTWKTEPRSNRYHYASRFARELPVFFVQPWSKPGTPLRVEPTEIPGVEVVHCSSALRAQDVLQFRQLLSKRRVRFPLLWIYNSLHYEPLIAAMPQALRVFHATEDFFTPSVGWGLDQQATAESVRRQLSCIDLLIAVSDGVLASCRIKGDYSGRALVVENGCDAAFLLSAVNAQPSQTVHESKLIAVFQGGINKRLDFELLHDLVRLLPDWEFWFCGSDEHGANRWRTLCGHVNVKYFGVLEPTNLANMLCSSTVGLIPFVQDEWIGNSFPLKALEYVACGLPVVSVPITALRRFSSDIYFARTAVEFSAALQAAARTRMDRASLNRRRQLAEENSYDTRFTVMIKALLAERERLAREVQGRLTIQLRAPSALELWTEGCASLAERLVSRMWRTVPLRLRASLKHRAQSLVHRAQCAEGERSRFERLLHATLKFALPARLRRRVTGTMRQDR